MSYMDFDFLSYDNFEATDEEASKESTVAENNVATDPCQNDAAAASLEDEDGLTIISSVPSPSSSGIFYFHTSGAGTTNGLCNISGDGVEITAPVASASDSRPSTVLPLPNTLDVLQWGSPLSVSTVESEYTSLHYPTASNNPPAAGLPTLLPPHPSSSAASESNESLSHRASFLGNSDVTQISALTPPETLDSSASSINSDQDTDNSNDESKGAEHTNAGDFSSHESGHVTNFEVEHIQTLRSNKRQQTSFDERYASLASDQDEMLQILHALELDEDEQKLRTREELLARLIQLEEEHLWRQQLAPFSKPHDERSATRAKEESSTTNKLYDISIAVASVAVAAAAFFFMQRRRVVRL